MTDTRNASPDTLGGGRDQSMGLEWLSAALFRRGIDVDGFATPAVAAVVALDHYRAEREGNPLANVAALYAAPSPKGKTDGEAYSGLINAAVDDLSIGEHWHRGRMHDEIRLIDDAFQNGVETAADAILAALSNPAQAGDAS